MTYQRRHGPVVEVWPQKEIYDRRGNRQLVVDMTAEPQRVRCAMIPDRSLKAEVPGQQVINVFSMIVDPSVKDIGVWARVRWNGEFWDIAGPPALHTGSRQTRHFTVPIRRRPDEGAPNRESVNHGQA